MKKLNLLYLLSLVVLFTACDNDDDPWGDWSKVASFPGRERVTAVSFQNSEGTLAYVGLGYNPNISEADKYLNDFYKFDGKSWALVENAEFPDVGRKGCVAFVIGDTAYVGAGYRGKSTLDPIDIYYSDFYKFVISEEKWAMSGTSYVKTDIKDYFPDNEATEFWGGIAFEFGGKGYAGTGQGDGFVSNTIFEYDPKTGGWKSPVNTFPGDKRVGASVFKMGKGTDKESIVVALGTNGSSSVLDVSVLNSNGWEKKYPLINTDGEFNDEYNGIPRSYAVAFTSSMNTHKEYGFIAAGSASTGWVYDIEYDRWHKVEGMSAQMPTYVGAVGFSIGGYGFIATGGASVGSASNSNVWKYEPFAQEESWNDF